MSEVSDYWAPYVADLKKQVARLEGERGKFDLGQQVIYRGEPVIIMGVVRINTGTNYLISGYVQKVDESELSAVDEEG